MSFDTMVDLLRKTWRFLHYRLIHAPRGGGKPVPRTALDEEYRSGNWDHFFGPDEKERHDIMIELIRLQAPQPSLLDLGCGSGRLASMLHATPLTHYMGIDISDEALKRAQSLGLTHGRFEQGSFETWRPKEFYDIITFNECLGYARYPAQTANDFARYLKPGGVVIVSHFRWGNYRAIWQSLESFFMTVAERTATNTKGQVWDLKVLRPRP